MRIQSQIIIALICFNAAIAFVDGLGEIRGFYLAITMHMD